MPAVLRHPLLDPKKIGYKEALCLMNTAFNCSSIEHILSCLVAVWQHIHVSTTE